MRDEYFLPIPEQISRRSDLSVYAKLVSGCLYRRTVKAKVESVMIQNDWIRELTAISIDEITRATAELVAAGVIEKKRTRLGNVYRWTLESADSGIKNPPMAESRNRQQRNQESADSGIKNPPTAECINTETNTQIETQKTTTLSVRGTRNTRPIRNDRQKVVLTARQCELAMILLGVTGEEGKLAEVVTQEQADREGFLESCLEDAISNWRQGKILGRPIGYLIGMIRNSWNEGRWKSQKQIDEAWSEERSKAVATINF